MPPDWNAIRLDLLDIDAPMRATLREMRPFFAKVLPGILSGFYDKVRQHDPSPGIFKDAAVQEAVRLQLQHWDLIVAAEFVGCRLMFIADQLTKAVEAEVEVPRYGRAAQAAARDKRALMQNAIARAAMLDTETWSQSISGPIARSAKTRLPMPAPAFASSSVRCRRHRANWKAPRAH
jgi:hypothetical protein